MTWRALLFGLAFSAGLWSVGFLAGYVILGLVIR